MIKALTVFTPTYNREQTLPRTFESLTRQVGEVFDQMEWLVVDDGSTDGTEKMVRGWMEAPLPFELRYIKQANGGKHTAFNRAVKEAKGAYFFTVDSDDWLPKDAISTVLGLLPELSKQPALAGIIALKSFGSGELIGRAFPENYPDSSAYELAVAGHGGERTLIFKTEVLRQYPFPVIEGEKFIGECVVYDRIDRQYKYRVCNKPLTVCEYQPDGLTSRLFATMMRNATGYKIYYAQRIDMARSLKERWRYAVHYVAFSLLKKEHSYNYRGRHRWLLGVAWPFGAMGFLYYKLKSKA